MAAKLTPQERTNLAASMTTRMLSANINAGAYATVSAAALKRPSETWAEYPPKLDRLVAGGDRVNKEKHLMKDGIKLCARALPRLYFSRAAPMTAQRLLRRYVEKALQLHDERKGMPVVASPIWAPKGAKK